MGYNLYITRQENWFDENDNKIISIEEWKEYWKGDIEMRLDNFIITKTNHEEDIKLEMDGVAVWTRYSKNGINGNYAWIFYGDGNIECKNPDEEIIGKLIDIASEFNAKVQGDECEVYWRSSDKIISKKATSSKEDQCDLKKPWWKLW